MKRVLTHLIRLICLLIAASAPAAQLTVEVILDCSASMNKTLSDRRTRLGAAVDVIAALAAALPDDGSAHLALRTFGGNTNLIDQQGCRDTTLIVPGAAIDQLQLATTLGGLTASGRSPVVLALQGAAEDLAEVDGPAMLILITDGLDSCGRDLESALVELRNDLPELTVQVAGIGLSRTATKVYTDLVPTDDPLSTTELVAVVAKSVAGAIPLDINPRAVSFDIIWSTEPPDVISTAELRAALSNASRPLTVNGNHLEGRAPGGFYNLTLITDNGTSQVSRIFVGSASNISLELPLPTTASLLPAVETIIGGESLEVNIQRAPPGAWITLVANDAPIHEVIERVFVPEGDSAVTLTSSPVPGIKELRLYQEISGPTSTMVGMAQITVLPATNWVEARSDEERVETDDDLEIWWDGPGGRDDVITIVPADSSPETVGPFVFVRDGAVLDLWAPGAGCAYEVRYLTQQAAIITDRQPLLVIQPLAGLTGPKRVRAGGTLQVVWFGPGEDLDFITIVKPAAAADVYRIWKPASSGSPMSLTAPLQSGAWEIRYVSGADNQILDRIDLEVEAVLISLSAPQQVRAGTRFKVSWTGPGGPGDFIVVAPRGSGKRAKIDFTPTSLGTPANLAAPFTAGLFEVRYISGPTGKILASIGLQVK